MRCENCKYALETKPGNHVCIRYPPVPVSIVDAYERDSVTGGKMVLAHSAFPPVNHDWYCGEWKPQTKDVQ